ncbi:hypothetical protein CWI38_2288p0010 [Hamiltosporidium tvaerminnensis]|uniref:Uncharacterized protein n=2 Tax=Hamiltosporidium TaxID=1176354 RepID=A0A4Q9L2A1_9MICR|nr:hypothetical protein CWI39_1471p0010 [Hamiltosporidium magnivora]TBU05462.1 hypothetical protein CWI36_0633p0030 [Hamiltosporidium magnivora]TBU08240.1 hypothetical protein CWI38_2288p0010 [Hamiltosporidium tvaerminnensis]
MLTETKQDTLEKSGTNSDDTAILDFVDDGVFSTIFLVFVLWRIVKSRKFKFSRFFKGNLRSFGIIFLFFSAISKIIYTYIFIYLAKKMIVNKELIDKMGFMKGHSFLYLYNRRFDLVDMFNIGYTLSHVLRISALFLLIGLWLPCAYTFAVKKRKNEIKNLNEQKDINLMIFSGNIVSISPKNIADAVSHASIVTFSTLYAFLRVPLSFIVDYNQKSSFFTATVFYRSVFYGFEIYAAVLFLLILEIKFLSIFRRENSQSRADKNVVENIHLLLIVLLLHSTLKYTINIIAMPIEMGEITLHVIKKIGNVVELILDVLLITMFCPLPTQIFESTNETSVYEKPLWRPSERLEYDKYSVGPIVCEADSPKIDPCERTIVELRDFREEIAQEK